MTPDKVHDCELHEGERGDVGSVITWHYTHGTYQACLFEAEYDQQNTTYKHKLFYITQII